LDDFHIRRLLANPDFFFALAPTLADVPPKQPPFSEFRFSPFYLIIADLQKWSTTARVERSNPDVRKIAYKFRGQVPKLHIFDQWDISP